MSTAAKRSTSRILLDQTLSSSKGSPWNRSDGIVSERVSSTGIVASSPGSEPVLPSLPAHQRGIISTADSVPAETSAKVAGFTDEEQEYFHEAFNVFDRDKSGAIDVEELTQVMIGLGIPVSQPEVRSMIARVDLDNTGCVEFDEFLKMMGMIRTQGRQMFGTEEELKEAFRLMDGDDDGYISSSDLMGVFDELGERSGEDEAEEMIRMVDLAGQGKVSFDDFVKMMTDNTLQS
ncbi:hypothetical protein HK104_000514 [Borealophlyctis nickersoniae]|nr:hypothetical protein HK104_000514 [Borealophlyctis nickersoniae]